MIKLLLDYSSGFAWEVNSIHKGKHDASNSKSHMLYAITDNNISCTKQISKLGELTEIMSINWTRIIVINSGFMSD